MNKEINWINWAKIYGMLLVYLYHTSYYLHLPDSGYNFYGPFFVNIFLFISGYLIFRKQLSRPVIDIPKKTWTQGEGRTMLSNILFRIALPTVIFSTINFFPKKILRGEEIDLWSFAHDTILGGSLWFTCTLTVAELLIFLLLLGVRRIFLENNRIFSAEQNMNGRKPEMSYSLTDRNEVCRPNAIPEE